MTGQRIVLSIAAVAALTLAVHAQVRDRAEVLLQAAIKQELVDGDLEGAIRQYQALVSTYGKTNRPVAAQALLGMAEAYQKMGDAQASTIYERILREYGDQTDIAASARARLSRGTSADAAARSAQMTGARAIQVWTPGSAASGFGTPSADGRYLPFMDPLTGDLAIRDLTAGTSRRLTDVKGWSVVKPGARVHEYLAGNAVMSADGTRIAYMWTAPSGEYELRVLPLTGSNTETIPTVVEVGADPVAWTPDAKRVLATRRLEDQRVQFSVFSVDSRAVQALETVGWASPTTSLSQDGRYIAYGLAPSADTAARDIFVLAMDGSFKTKLVEHAADDESPLWSPDGSQVFFFSDRTGSRSLWTAPVQAGRPAGAPALVKADVGPVRALGITRNGAIFYSAERNLLNIDVAAIDAAGAVTAAPAPATQRYLNSNDHPAWSPDGRFLAFTSLRRSSDETLLIIRMLETGEEREVVLPLRVPVGLTSGPVRWFPDGRSLLVLSNDVVRGSVFGYYRVDIMSGKAQRLLTTFARTPASAAPDLSPDGNAIFYGDLAPADKQLLLRFDVDSRRTTVLRETGITGLAVSPDGAQIAYGVAHGAGSGNVSIEVMPSAGGPAREVYRGAVWRYWGLTWTPDQKHLLFVRPEDGSANARSALVRLRVDGGEAVDSGIHAFGLRHPQVHPDGRRILFGVYEPSREIWALENLPSRPAATR